MHKTRFAALLLLAGMLVQAEVGKTTDFEFTTIDYDKEFEVLKAEFLDLREKGDLLTIEERLGIPPSEIERFGASLARLDGERYVGFALVLGAMRARGGWALFARDCINRNILIFGRKK